MQCFRCDNEAVQECARCGALYCDDHGDALCERCMDPALALPSYRVYRGSLLALFVGTLFAVWLLVRPGDEADADAPPSAVAGIVATATPARTGTPAPGGQASPPPAGSPAASPTPPPPGSPSASPPAGSATPAGSPTPEPRRHTVRPGDTLTGIAAEFRPPSVTATEYLERIAQANGISQSATLSVGQILVLP